MLPVWVYLGLAAQLLWILGAIIDKFLIAKYFSSDEESSSSVGVLVLFSSVFIISISLFAVIFGFKDITFQAIPASIAMLIGFANALWVIMYLYAIEKTELSRTIPLFQTTPIFGFILGYLLLSETLLISQMFSALAVIIGAFVLSYHFSSKSFAWKPMVLMLGASFLIAVQETIFKIQAIEFSYWHSAFWMGIGFALFGLLLYIFNQSYRRQFHNCLRSNNRTIWFANGTNEAIDNTANLIAALAITLGPIALVQSINAYQPVLMLITSYLVYLTIGDFLDEDISKTTIVQKIIGVTIITTGSVWLYLTL